MKKYLLLLLITLSFGACKKGQDAVEPKSLASEVAGTYTLTSFRYQDAEDSYQVPQLPIVQKGKKTDFGTVELREMKGGEGNQVQMGLSLTLPTIGLEVDEDDFAEFDVEKSGSKYVLSVKGEKFATVSGKTFSLDVKGNDFRMAFTADR